MATPQTTLLGRFCFLNYRQQLFLFFLHTKKKRPKKTISIFVSKWRLNPFEKIQYGHSEHLTVYNWSFRSFQQSKLSRNIFSYSFNKKKKPTRRFSFVNSKSWVNPVGKYPIWQPPKSNSFTVSLFGLFSSLHYHYRSYLFLSFFYTQSPEQRDFNFWPKLVG